MIWTGDGWERYRQRLSTLSSRSDFHTLSSRPTLLPVIPTEHSPCHPDRTFPLSSRPSEASGGISRGRCNVLPAPKRSLHSAPLRAAPAGMTEQRCRSIHQCQSSTFVCFECCHIGAGLPHFCEGPASGPPRSRPSLTSSAVWRFTPRMQGPSAPLGDFSRGCPPEDHTLDDGRSAVPPESHKCGNLARMGRAQRRLATGNRPPPPRVSAGLSREPCMAQRVDRASLGVVRS